MPRRVLLDECSPLRLKAHLKEFEVATVRELEWAGKKNGELLAQMQEDGYEVLVTVDQSLPHQQHIKALRIAVVVLLPRQNRWREIMPLIPRLRAALSGISPGQVIRIKD